MVVGKRMKREPVTIRPEDSLRHAMNLVKEKRVRHLPVVDDKGRLVGVVSDRDIRAAWASSATSLEVRELHYLLEKVKIEEIMTKKVITVSPNTTIEDAALLMHDNRIGCLPVVEDDRLLGLITETDIFAAFVEVMGLGTESSRIEVVMEDRPGMLAAVAEIIRDQGFNIASVAGYRHEDPRKVVNVFRVKVPRPESLVAALKRAGFEVLSVIPPVE